MKKFSYLILLVFLFYSCSKSDVSSNAGGSNGKGGSLARFTIVGNYLYTVDAENLGVYNVSNAADPVYLNKISVGFNIEAVYPFKNKLFIASNDAMYIYNLTNPEAPEFESATSHFTGCDPIAANDSIAFLTVHGGTTCRGNINELYVYDIRNFQNPVLIDNKSMTNPFGLGLKDDHLFVCDNGVGLKIYNVSDPYHIQQVSTYNGNNFIDVIIDNQLLIGMLTNGIGFWNISDPANPVLHSTITQ